MEAESTRELKAVLPIKDRAINEVKQLKGADVTEMKGFANPPVAAISVAKALCIFKGEKPKKIKGQTAAEGTKDDYWEPCKKKILNPQLLPMMQGFVEQKLDTDIKATLKPLLESDEFDEDVLKKASKAALGIAKWFKAIVRLDDAKLKLAPLEEATANAKAAAAEA